MGIFDWHQKLVKRISERNINLAILGKVLFAISIGSMFSIELVKYGYFILIISVVLIVNYVTKNFLACHGDSKLNYSTHMLGWIGAISLVLFFGIQSPQIPFKIHILGIGVLLLIPAVVDLFNVKDYL